VPGNRVHSDDKREQAIPSYARFVTRHAHHVRTALREHVAGARTLECRADNLAGALAPLRWSLRMALATLRTALPSWDSWPASDVVVVARWFWLAAAMLAIAWFAPIQYRDLFHPDEGRYAEIPREMILSGDWVTPRLNDLKYFEKPPLQYWATAAAYIAFGQSEWSARLWPALLGFLGVAAVLVVGKALFDLRTGMHAALILASSLLFMLYA
jgi:Dolichyl-phosphate-mannose-protein mannosyltransferase